jgi:hypothetical protein
VTIPVQVSVLEGDGYTSFGGEARDFSKTGLCLVLTRQLEKGTAVSMEFTVPYNSQALAMRGIVRYRSGFHHGIEFISITADQKEALERTSKILDLLS